MSSLKFSISLHMPLAQHDSICLLGDIPALGSNNPSCPVFFERTATISKGKNEVWSTIEPILVPRNSDISYRFV